jgi:hypothetical protein
MIELIVKTHSQKVYDITELVTKVSYDDKLNDGCSKLEFSYIGDDLLIENGNEVRFKYDEIYVFAGRVFSVSTDSKKEISVTAYDQLRYAKGKDYFYIKGKTLTYLVDKMCNHFNFSKGHIEDTKKILKTQIYDDKTYLDIVYEGIKEVLTNFSKFYALRDECGKITLRDINDLKLDILLGDESLCYDYSYEKSIDEGFYNQVIILAKNDEKTSIQGAKDDKSIKKYGPMQFFDIMENTNAAKAKNMAEIILKACNHEAETLSLNCLGDIRIRAGVSFYVMIDSITGNKMKRYIATSVTHDFIPVHTMKIEVLI